MPLVIAIDGPAASGKSSVARKVAERMGAIFVNTGNMFRAVTWAALRAQLNLDDHAAIAALVTALDLDFVAENGKIITRIDGRPLIDEELNSEAVNGAVSFVARVPEVRSRLVAEQRALVVHGDLVMEGRDIGSVIFPDTPHKFYIDASEEVRAARRLGQGLADTVALRDKLDSNRKNAPLMVADGAFYIDSSDLTLDEVVAKVLAQIGL